MTRSRYYLALILQSFGIGRKMKIMTQNSRELHLMQEGEEFLGSYCWPEIEGIEELSMEYWKLRENTGKQKSLVEQLQKAEEHLWETQQKRDELTAKIREAEREPAEKMDQLILQSDELHEQKSRARRDAEQIKRRFQALKLKASVITNEGSVEEKSAVDEERSDLKRQFEEQKKIIEKIDEQITQLKQRSGELRAEMAEASKERRAESNDIYGLISKANQEIGAIRSELGALDDDYRSHCRSVGRFLNINRKDKRCLTACRQQSSLLNQVGLLRKSITWNKNLLARLGG